MNGRQAKKMRRVAKQEVAKRFGAEFAMIRKMVRTRPRLVPKWLWRRLSRWYFTDMYRERLLGTLEGHKSKWNDDITTNE